MQQQELFGHLSSIDGHPALDNIPLDEGQLVAVKHGKSEYLLGRIRVGLKGRWFLDHSEFVGHTYINVPLTPAHLDELTVKRVKKVKTTTK